MGQTWFPSQPLRFLCDGAQVAQPLWVSVASPAFRHRLMWLWASELRVCGVLTALA